MRNYTPVGAQYEDTLDDCPKISPERLKQLKAQLVVIQIIAETARDAGSLGAPAGPIYAALMEKLPQITVGYFDTCVEHLVEAGLVTYQNHCVTWVL